MATIELEEICIKEGYLKIMEKNNATEYMFIYS
jgi:hypothetical protein